ncbi:hypothetical protein AB3S75_010363 [Citrus x aurantiifolia]
MFEVALTPLLNSRNAVEDACLNVVLTVSAKSGGFTKCNQVPSELLDYEEFSVSWIMELEAVLLHFT